MANSNVNDGINRGLNGCAFEGEIVLMEEGLWYAGDGNGGGTADTTTKPGTNLARRPYHAIYIGTGGDLVCNLANGLSDTLTFKNIPDGTTLQLEIAIIDPTTTCTDMIGLWNRN